MTGPVSAKPAVQAAIEENSGLSDWYDAGDHLRDAAAEAAVRAAAPLIVSAVRASLTQQPDGS